MLRAGAAFLASLEAANTPEDGEGVEALLVRAHTPGVMRSSLRSRACAAPSGSLFKS